MTTEEMMNAAIERGLECGAVRIRLRDGQSECEVWLSQRGPEPEPVVDEEPHPMAAMLRRVACGGEV